MSKKENNEITVKIKGNLENLYSILQNKQFKIIEKFSLDDTYFIPENLEIDKLSTREILSKAVLIRENIHEEPEAYCEKTLTLKKKEFDINGNIINQRTVDCEIVKSEEAKDFIKLIGYREIMNIKENDVVYEKDGFGLAVKNIENGEKLIEVETNLKNPNFDTIEKVKKKIVEIDIPIYLDDFFVKKAEIELDKRLKR